MEIKMYLPQIVATLIAIVLLPLSKYIIQKLIFQYGLLLQKSEKRRAHVKRILNIILNVTFLFVLAVIWGVRPQNLLIGLSSIFAVIGVAFFAQWSVLSNITAGIVMYFNAPFRIGDRIHIIDKDIPIIATIEDIHTFYTHIRTDEQELIVIPNNLFLQKIVSVKDDDTKAIDM
ncbi:MscS family membrane protein [Parabacteroides sp. PFB2-12]|uniref:mechanosensitive ion channel family protein n=1 Tax=unclassified Parabacteroides TaxID=2649774 RepID=UPI002475D2F7|nr:MULTISPECIES: mechanosensitive ion channel family protein [unclassified Parabacteroides]MDH6343042.1 MscS family membrane protein [Parabacteroides sp. PM6-13]MDH6390445.1 MscS family membrane protein [Parabacteroides sp. PFB2-12]